MRLRYKRWISLLLAVVMMLTLGACGVQSQSDTTDKIAFDSLEKTGQMTLAYATQYQVEYYGDYSLITIGEDQRFLLVPEGKDLPKNLPEDVVALQQPLDKTYLVSTSVMDLIRQLDCISYIRLSGSKAKDWYITEAKEAIEAGNMIYAGKYSAPGYECILNEGCNLAIENTMIYHTPEVKEKLEELGFIVYPSQTNYLLFRSPDEDSRDYKQGCLEHGILIRACENFEGLNRHYYRVAVRNRGENERLIHILKEVQSEDKHNVNL